MPTIQDWQRSTPPTSEQQEMLDTIHDKFIHSAIGWQHRAVKTQPPLLPDVKEFVKVYGKDAIRDIANKSLPSDWMGATSIQRASTKSTLIQHLRDEGWLGHYGNETLSEFIDWREDEKLNKWHLQGILKILSYVYFRQYGNVLTEEEFNVRGIASNVEFFKEDGQSIGEETGKSRLFARPKDIIGVTVKGNLKVTDVSHHSHRGLLKKPTRTDEIARSNDSVFMMTSMLEDYFTGGEGELDVENIRKLRDICDIILDDDEVIEVVKEVEKPREDTQLMEEIERLKEEIDELCIKSKELNKDWVWRFERLKAENDKLRLENFNLNQPKIGDIISVQGLDFTFVGKGWWKPVKNQKMKFRREALENPSHKTQDKLNVMNGYPPYEYGCEITIDGVDYMELDGTYYVYDIETHRCVAIWDEFAEIQWVSDETKKLHYERK
tara:strand:+ start:95 stop:1408 length:1314 start_codon:yes stop_codon:yes gene_type:complete